MAIIPAQIAAEALDSVSEEITGVIKVAQLIRPGTEGAWNSTDGQYDPSTPDTETGRALKENSNAVIKDAFPNASIQPTQDVFFLEGFTIAPKVGWQLSISGGATYEIKAVSDILLAVSLFYVIAEG